MILFVLLNLIHLLFIATYFKKHLNYSFKLNFSFRKHHKFKEIMTFCLFMILGTGSGVLVTKLDTVMLESITSNKGFVGIYTIALSIAAFIEMPRRPISQITVPIIAKDLANNNIEKVSILYKKSSLNLMIIGAVMFSLIWINIDFVLNLIASTSNNDTYKTGKYIVFFLGLAKLFDLALGINSEIIHNSKYYKWNIILMPFLAIITIALNYYFITKYNSATGAAIATFFSILLYNIMRTILVSVKLKMLPFSKEYFLTIPFIFIPFILDYTILPIEMNIWLKMIFDSFFVILFFCLPVYLLKISPDINKMVNSILRNYLKLKV